MTRKMDYSDVTDAMDLSCVQTRPKKKETESVRKSKFFNRLSKEYASKETKGDRNSAIFETVPHLDVNAKSATLPTPPVSPTKTVPERKTSKFRKLIGMKKSSVDQPPPQYLQRTASRTSSEFYVNLNFSGILMDRQGKEKCECRANLDSETLRWIIDKKKESILIQNITSITASNVSDTEWTSSFELTMNSMATLQIPNILVFSARSSHERDLWMQKLLEVMAPNTFQDSLASSFARAGLVTIKEGIGGETMAGWLMLREREIHYWMQTTGSLIAADLRLTRRIENQKTAEGPLILLDLPERSLYIRGTSEAETSRWMCSLREAVIKNGLQLEQQQLTSQLVPIIVETCIDFIATHGCDIEGLYENEQDNDMTIVSQLLSRFRIMDARELHLDSFKALDVATALKIFFASLPNTLFSKSLTSSLVNIANTEYNTERRAGMYRVAIQEELSQVELMTSRKLLGHLHLLHLHSKDNKMDATRLAATWTSALMPAEHQHQEKQRVLAELISEYPLVYGVSCEEIAREVQMQTAVRKFRDSMKREREHEKPSSLNIWISIGGYFSNDAVQVKITPEVTAAELCENHGPGLVLQEFVLSGSLYRPLHPMQLVYDVVLAWSDWDEADRRDNQLVLATCLIYDEIKAQAKARALTKGELRFADTSSRHPISCEVELDQVSLHCYRDKRLSLKLGQWKVNDLVWYIGHEPKRESFSKWNITFYSRKEKPRAREYFGSQLGGSSNKELHYWSAGLFLAQFPGFGMDRMENPHKKF